jgi:V/A-type H+-transporting ATPase subunit D
MTALKLTKSELRTQQVRLQQLQRYLPTLRLKKAMLQIEVNNATLEVESVRREREAKQAAVEPFSALLEEKVACDVLSCARVQHVLKRYENIAGVEIPIFERVVFRPPDYFLFDTPAWTDAAVEEVREIVIAIERLTIAQEKKRALEKELRDVSIRVNLFEKVLIPRSIENLKKIKVFLGDQQLAAVAQAKVTKRKLVRR